MKFDIFRAVPLPIIRSLFTVFEQDQELVLLESCLQTSMTYTSAEYAVNKLLIMGRGTAQNM
jgi:hypothetical protein